MFINTNLAADTSAVNLQQEQLDTPNTSSPASSSPAADSSASLDPSLLRLTETPASIPDDDFAIQDEAGANQAMENLRQSMLGQPGMVMAAQGNQFSEFRPYGNGCEGPTQRPLDCNQLCSPGDSIRYA